MSQPTKPSTEITPFSRARAVLNDENLKREISHALPKHMTPDRMLRVALTACLKQPKIAEACMTEAGRTSIRKAMLDASQLGLEVDGRQGHLIPFKDKNLGMIVQFIPGYQGMIGLAYNHPKVKAIWADVVYSKDKFVHKKGLDRVLEHEPADADDRGELTHAYAVCEMEGGAKTFVCMTKRDVMKAKASSRGSDSNYSPWVTFPEAMWAKTAIRNLAKFIPQSTELRQAIEIDDEASDVIDINTEPTPSSKPSFTNPELEAPAETPVDKPVDKTVEAEAVKNPTLSDSAVKLIAAVDAMKVNHDDFCGWLKSTGRFDVKGNPVSSIGLIPDELCEKFLKDPGLEKCKTIFGKKEQQETK